MSRTPAHQRWSQFARIPVNAPIEAWAFTVILGGIFFPPFGLFCALWHGALVWDVWHDEGPSASGANGLSGFFGVVAFGLIGVVASIVSAGIGLCLK